MFSAVCYGKKFGPKGYGYGQGGGALQSDCYANGWVFRAETETGTREIYPASRLLHSHYIRCACLLNSLLSEEIRSARYWPRWGYVDRAAVRYWGRGVRVPLVMLLFATISLYVCACVCLCVCLSIQIDFLRELSQFLPINSQTEFSNRKDIHKLQNIE